MMVSTAVRVKRGSEYRVSNPDECVVRLVEAPNGDIEVRTFPDYASAKQSITTQLKNALVVDHGTVRLWYNPAVSKRLERWWYRTQDQVSLSLDTP